ncbi:hypothetical protein AB0J35_61045 [Nonomuraea angiospora]|uniref:hypothetical protein n=1 Tax=Nonomuraea angiospora TaxID=46172 RepID=UPI00341C3DF7
MAASSMSTHMLLDLPGWTFGRHRIHGELTTLGIKVAPSTVWEILKQEGLDPPPEQASTTWADFLRSQADAIMAADFFETVTLNGQRQCILALIEHATRRIPRARHHRAPERRLGRSGDQEPGDGPERCGLPDALSDPRSGWEVPALMNEILAEAGIKTVLTGIRMPRMNSIMERWVRSCRRELLDRRLVWNEHHLRHALREHEHFYTSTEPIKPWTQQRRCAPSPIRSRIQSESPT